MKTLLPTLTRITCLGLFLLLFANISIAQKHNDDISLGKYKILYSEIIGEERTLLIHLPENYEKSDKKYPVLYMLYGNHTTTYFAETVSILDQYGSDGQMPEVILVAITNTNRYRDLLPIKRDGSPSGINEFLDFFEKELFPYIEKNYRTKEYRMLMGPQAGANFAMYTMFNKPEYFDAFIINNPYRWSTGREILMQNAKDYFQKHTEFKKYLFITHDMSDKYEIKGNEYIEQFSEMLSKYQPKGFRFETNFLKDNKDFLTPLGLRKGIKGLFKDYPFPEELQVNGLKDIVDYYEKLSAKIGFPVDVPAHVLVMKADALMASGQTKAGVEILNYMIEHKAGAENAYWRLGNMHYRAGNLMEAREYLDKMLEIVSGEVGMIQSRYDKIEKMINESVAYELEQLILNYSLVEARKSYREIKQNAKHYFDEAEINTAAYRFMRRKEYDEAAFLFRINVKQYPQSANAFDSYAEVLLALDKKKEALENYKKSLELNPENENAKKMIEELQKK